MTGDSQKRRNFRWILIAVMVGAMGVSILVTALLVNIFERKAEELNPYVRLVEVTEDTTDASIWGQNFPMQYDGYLRTALPTRTRFGGHGGSESLPEQKADMFPWLTRMFQGYAFAMDYRERRGHAYMLVDQEQTQRLSVPQSGSCLHCHSSVMPLYRKLGDGDADLGFERSHALSYAQANAMLHEMGHAHPVSCVDCHAPTTNALRVTRPGFIRGIRALAEGDGAVPAFPSIEQWRQGNRKNPYDPNVDATRNEMRSFVCGQCHVEYYCAGRMPLEFPWKHGLTVDQTERHWNETRFPDGARFYDFTHRETGAELLKAQHPEFELWSQGIHARSGVTCSDCHMPYMREGASKISDHWIRSPLLNVNRACQSCHRTSEAELIARVDAIQERNFNLLQRAGGAMMDLLDAISGAMAVGATPTQLEPVLELQRKAHWRIDFVASENSMGFHAPQEAARILADAIDYVRQGQAAALHLQRDRAMPAPTPADVESPEDTGEGAEPDAAEPRVNEAVAPVAMLSR